MFSGIRLHYILTCLFSSNKLLVDIFSGAFCETDFDECADNESICNSGICRNIPGE